MMVLLQKAQHGRLQLSILETHAAHQRHARFQARLHRHQLAMYGQQQVRIVVGKETGQNRWRRVRRRGRRRRGCSGDGRLAALLHGQSVRAQQIIQPPEVGQAGVVKQAERDGQPTQAVIRQALEQRAGFGAHVQRGRYQALGQAPVRLHVIRPALLSQAARIELGEFGNPPWQAQALGQPFHALAQASAQLLPGLIASRPGHVTLQNLGWRRHADLDQRAAFVQGVTHAGVSH